MVRGSVEVRGPAVIGLVWVVYTFEPLYRIPADLGLHNRHTWNVIRQEYRGIYKINLQ